jgi:hypothetical protein
MKKAGKDVGAGRLRKAVSFHALAKPSLNAIELLPGASVVSSNAALAVIAHTDALTAVFGGVINQKDHAGAAKLLLDVLGNAA